MTEEDKRTMMKAKILTGLLAVVFIVTTINTVIELQKGALLNTVVGIVSECFVAYCLIKAMILWSNHAKESKNTK